MYCEIHTSTQAYCRHANTSQYVQTYAYLCVNVCEIWGKGVRDVRKGSVNKTFVLVQLEFELFSNLRLLLDRTKYTHFSNLANIAVPAVVFLDKITSQRQISASYVK